MAQKFQRRGIVEAVQWTGENLPEVRSFVGFRVESTASRRLMNPETGLPITDRDDWIMRGGDGKLLVMKNAAFMEAYEPLV